MFKNRKNNNKKGFTLVEVIVVLVILAILAAIMIPALTGYIEKANKKTAMVEARAVLLATQTVASENYPKSIVVGTNDKLETGAATEVKDLSEVEGTIDSVKIDNNSKVTKLVYKTGKYTVTYENKKFTVAE